MIEESEIRFRGKELAVLNCGFEVKGDVLDDMLDVHFQVVRKMIKKCLELHSKEGAYGVYFVLVDLNEKDAPDKLVE